MPEARKSYRESYRESHWESYWTPPSQMPRADARGHLHTVSLCKGHGETLSSALLWSDWKQRLRGTETAFSLLSDRHITITLQKQTDCPKNCTFPGDFKEAFAKQQITSEIERKKCTVNKLSQFHQICNQIYKRSWGRQPNFFIIIWSSNCHYCFEKFVSDNDFLVLIDK